MKQKTRFFIILVTVIALISSCNLPANQQEVNNNLSTFAAQTVAAMLSSTPAVVLSTPTIAPVNTVPTLTQAPPPTVATVAPITATSICNAAKFITDVTIPDGTLMTPGQTFVKKWRVQNVGTCAWTGYSAVFDSGESMSGPASKPLGTVNPGQEVDIEISLTAPTATGTYRGYWRIVTNANVLVPVVNGAQGRSFYVDIKVQSNVTATVPTPVFTVTVPVLFAVSSVNYSIGTWSDAANTNCPRVTANITATAAGTVKFKWTRMDTPGGGAEQSIVFSSAGTQSVNYDWTRGAVLNGTPTWVGIYVGAPNNQDFGHIDFSTACTSP